jgi:hypothetical protein
MQLNPVLTKAQAIDRTASSREYREAHRRELAKMFG